MHPGLFRVQRRDARLSRMRRAVLTSARLHEATLPAGGFRFRAAMLTCTYREARDWDAGHIRALLTHLREWARRKGFRLRYVWVAELQKRGAMHYHVLLWLPFRMPMPDRCGWWPHGSTKVEWARSAGGYLAKYASKAGGPGHEFPRASRIHGCGGLDRAAAQCRSWWMLPRDLRTLCIPEHRMTRAPGGGWVSRATGEWRPPRYALLAAGHHSALLAEIEPAEWLPLSPLKSSSLLSLREVATFGKSQGGRESCAS